MQIRESKADQTVEGICITILSNISKCMHCLSSSGCLNIININDDYLTCPITVRLVRLIMQNGVDSSCQGDGYKFGRRIQLRCKFKRKHAYLFRISSPGVCLDSTGLS